MSSCSYIHLSETQVASLKNGLLDDVSTVALAETFKVLGDTTRVRILDALSRAELCVCDLARLLGLSESATSHQLRLLRGMRLVRPRRAGRSVYYTLDDQHIVGLFEQGLEHIEERAPASERDGRLKAETNAVRLKADTTYNYFTVRQTACGERRARRRREPAS